MKNLIITGLMLIVFTSCGKPKDAEIISGAVYVEDLYPYVDEFKARMAIASIPVPPEDVHLEVSKEMPNTILGSCGVRLNPVTVQLQPHVKINHYLWLRLTVPGREQLIFHELGHCWLNRGHNDAVDGNSTPVSIMNSFHFSPSIYVAGYEAYIQELFQVTAPLFTGIAFDGAVYASTVSEQSYVMPLTTETTHYECGWEQ